MKKLLLPFLLIVSLQSYGQYTNNLYQLMEAINIDSISALPDSLKNPSDKSLIRANLRWARQLTPHGNTEIAAAAIASYAKNFVPIANNFSIGAAPISAWTEIGPIGNSGASYDDRRNGQIHRIVFHPDYNIGGNKSIYATSFFGGVWKSTNGGNHWDVLGTDHQLPLTSASGIAISYQDTNKLFICTGEGDERSFKINSNTNNFEYNPNFSIGTFRSLDNGNTWNQMDYNLLADFASGGVCRNIKIDPTNDNNLFMVTSRGFYRSTNASQPSPTWNKIQVANQSLNADFRGLEFHPTNSSTMYISGTDIFKSTDGGATWTSLTVNTPGLDLNNIAPNFNLGRINIAVSPDAPDRLYAYIVDVVGTSSSQSAVYMLENNAWQQLNYQGIDGKDKPDVNFMALAVSPSDADVIFFGTTIVHGNSGATSPNIFSRRSAYEASVNGDFHADVHALVFEPNTINNPKLFCGNHGGISVKDVTFNNHLGWSYKNNGLNTNLIWSFDVSKANSKILGIGTQDNGVRKTINDLQEYGWFEHWGGDGYATQIVNDAEGDSYTPGLAYLGSNQDNYGQLAPWRADTCALNPPTFQFQGNWRTGRELFPKEFQVIDHPVTNNPIYGFSDLYTSILPNHALPIVNQSPSNFFSMEYQIESDLYAIPFNTTFPVSRENRQVEELDISKSNPDYIYVATKAAHKAHTRFYRSTTGLRNGAYHDITNGQPATTTFQEITSSLPVSTRYGFSSPPYITGIAISPVDHLTLWISVSGYETNYRVFKSTDGGNTWINADPSNSLPEMPANNIVVQEGTNDRLFIATNVGVYYTENGMNDWQKVSDIPNTQVFEIRINTCSNKLFAATYGRGVWSVDLPESNGYDHEREITTNTVYNNSEFLERNLRIKSGSKLTITETLYMPYNGKIIVEPGATLELDGGTIKNNCGTFWDGIEVWGNSSLNQSGNNQGKLILKNDAVLENAHTAVSLWKEDDWNSMGGIIQAEDATFKNCRRAVQFMSYKKRNNSYFERCKFELDDDFNSEGLDEINQVTLWDVKGVNFSGCAFEDNRTVPSDFSLSTGKAIFSIDAGYQLTGDCNDPNQTSPCPSQFVTRSSVKNFNYGVHATGAGTSNTITIDQTDFEGNMQATVVELMDNFRFIRNNVTVGGTLKNGYILSNQFGLYADQSSGFEIEANTFEGAGNSVAPIGVYVEASGTEANQVYENDFNGNEVGQWYKGLNRNENQLEGLQFLCNTNSQANTKDVLVELDINKQGFNFHGIRTYQGAINPSQSAGNQFAPSSVTHFENSSVQGIVYYYNSSAEQMDPNKYSQGLIMEAYTNNSNACPTFYRSSYNGSVVGALGSEFYTLRGQYESMLYAYFQNIDGGNTDSLLQAINMSWSSSAQNLRDELMSQAPYLSEEALREAASSGTLTDALLLEVCLANLDATRSEEFLNFLENEIPNTLPESMVQLVYQNWSGQTPRTILENQLAVMNAQLGVKSNQLLYYYMTDSTDHADSITSLLLARKHPASVYRTVELAIASENYEDVNLVFTEIEEGPELSEWKLAEHNNLKDYVTFRQQINGNNKVILDLNEEELSTLRTIAIKKTGRSSQMAQNILCFGYGECATSEAPQSRQRSRRVYDMNTPSPIINIEGNYSMVPNPASTAVNLLIEGEITESAKMLRLFNLSGQIVIERILNTTNTTIEVNQLENGAYLYEVFEVGAVVHQGKLIIQK